MDHESVLEKMQRHEGDCDWQEGETHEGEWNVYPVAGTESAPNDSRHDEDGDDNAVHEHVHGNRLLQ